MARSFCGDLGHRQAARLQGATHHQADHGEGADQHADRMITRLLRSLILGNAQQGLAA